MHQPPIPPRAQASLPPGPPVPPRQRSVDSVPAAKLTRATRKGEGEKKVWRGRRRRGEEVKDGGGVRDREGDGGRGGLGGR